MDLLQYDHYMIVDLEATCCDQGSVPHKEMETIEIGAVMIEKLGLNVVDEFSIFIKPVRTPILTDFCTELTTIRQDDVDGGSSFEAVGEFQEWYRQYENRVFCSWGDYDRKQLERDALYHGIPYPMEDNHINIKKQFSAIRGTRRQYGMAGALRSVGLTLAGTHHRGIDDARNMAKLMPYILRRKSFRS